MEDIKILSELFKSRFGVEPSVVNPLASAGGDRRYFRLVVPERELSVIGTAGDCAADCRSFIALDSVFFVAGVCRYRRFYAVSDAGMHYLQQDLGDVSLFSLLGKEEECRPAVRLVLKNLVRMQLVPQELWERSTGYSPFCRRQVLWDLNYFKYEFLKPSGVQFDEELLEDDFDRMAEDLVGVSSSVQGFMMRDCQSRNVMMGAGVAPIL